MLDAQWNIKLIDFGDAKDLMEEDEEEEKEKSDTSSLEESDLEEDDFDFAGDEGEEELKDGEGARAKKRRTKGKNSYYEMIRERQDTFCGTPNYLSPEVIKMQPHTTAIDIWALALIYFKMLTGKPAFPGSNQGMVQQAIL